MRKLTFVASDELLDALAAELFEAGAGGLVEEASRLVAYVSNEQEEQALKQAALRLASQTGGAATIDVESENIDDSWQSTWQDALSAVRLSERWVLRPTHASPAPEGEGTIWFQPQTSFGDGSHPTTQLAAKALIAWLAEIGTSNANPVRVVDVGAGNGVLSLIALMEAAIRDVQIERLLAIDIDEVAINSILQNMELNHIAPSDIETRLGTLGHESTSFDLVIANINTPVLLELAERLSSALASDGRLLLTGLLVEDESAVTATFQDLGLRKVTRDRQGEWSLLVYEHDQDRRPR